MGFDVHRLVEGRELWLGGIKIEHTLGLLGHSDADVLIHAICDALLGAANMRDIGYHFPDTGAEFHNIDSKILNRRVTLYRVFILVLAITITTCHINRTRRLYFGTYGTHLRRNTSVPEIYPVSIL